MKIRKAPYALRIVERKTGKAGIVYRRSVDEKGRNRLLRVAAISPLAFRAGYSLLARAAKESNPERRGDIPLAPGPFLPLNSDWGVKLAVYALLCRGLTSAEGLNNAASHLLHAEPSEAAWWLGLMTNSHADRAVRALRILTEAVK